MGGFQPSGQILEQTSCALWSARRVGFTHRVTHRAAHALGQGRGDVTLLMRLAAVEQRARRRYRGPPFRQTGARLVLAHRELAATLEVLPLLVLEAGKLTQIVYEYCRQKFSIADASLFHAFQHLQSMRELAASEHQDIRGVDYLGL